MKPPFLAALLFSLLSAFSAAAQNTEPVDPLIDICIAEGGSHQECACTSLNVRSEIGEQNYSELLGVVARMAALKARGLDTPVTAPNAGLGEFQYLSGLWGALTQRDNSLGLAYQANRDLCIAQSQN